VNELKSEPESGSKWPWSVLVAVLIIECLGAAALVTVTAVGAVRAENQPFGDVMSVLIMAVLATVFAVICLAGALAQRGWSRAASFVLQVLAFAVATAMFQHILGTVLMGWGLVLLSVVGAIGVVAARAKDQMVTDPSADVAEHDQPSQP
jgi:drug/metabolite transporter (DMT)-like permease